MSEGRNLTKEEEGDNYRPCYICLCVTCGERDCKLEECDSCDSESNPITYCEDYRKQLY